jgi:hypothetical protein
MTVILMLAMFAIFLTIDYLRKNKDVAARVEAEKEAAVTPTHSLPPLVAGFQLPENRHYHYRHYH